MSGNDSKQAVKKYLKSLTRELSHLSIADREDIAREIEDHILEKWENDSNGAFDEETLQGVLGKMGSPEYIAGQYCEQRGWAKPPQKHTVRNAVLITLVALVLICGFGGYLSFRYVLFPFAGLFSGSIVEVGDDGVRILNDTIIVDDDGVKIKGLLEVGEGGVEISGKKGKIRIGDFSIDGKINLTSIEKLLETDPIAKEAGRFSISAGKINEFDLDISSGDVTVNGANTNEIKVEFEKRIYGDDQAKAKKYLMEMGVSHEVDEGEVKIWGKNPFAKMLSYPDGIDGIAYKVNIQMPRKLKGRIECKNCNLDVTSIDGPLDVEAKYGQTRIEDIKNNMTIDGKYGNVNLKNIGGNLDFDGKYGEAIIEEVKGTLDLDAKYGTVSVGGIQGDIDVDAKYGNVELKLIKDYGFEFAGSSKFGEISCDFPTNKNGDDLSAKVGDGKHRVRVNSKFGNVNVKR